MKPSELSLSERIDLLNWTSAMRMQFEVPTEERLFNADHKTVSAIIRGLGYPVTYSRMTKIYAVVDRFNDVWYSGNPHVDYGHVRLILTAKRGNTVLGGLTVSWVKQLEVHHGIHNDGYPQMPAFRNYDELQTILREYFRMYEKFKVAVHESGFYASVES